VQIATGAPLTRTDDRVVAGVAGALAVYLHMPKLVARVAMMVLAVAGFGIAFYVLCWVLIPDAESPSALSKRLAPRDWLDLAAIAAVAAGITDLFAVAGFGLPERLFVPILLAAVGLVLVMSVSGVDSATTRPTNVALPSWLPPGAAAAVDVLGTRRGVLVRAAIGLVLVVGGIATLLGTSGSWATLRTGVIAFVVIGCGLFLVFGPWLWRL